MQESILSFFHAHPLLTGSASVWVILSTIVNVILAMMGPQAWVNLMAKNPTVALVLGFMRYFGIDLVGLITHLQAFLNQMASENPPTVPPVTPSSTSGESK